MTSSYFPIEDEWAEEDFFFPEPAVREGTFPVEFAVILGAVLVAVTLGWGALGLVKQPAEAVTSQPSANTEADSEELTSPPGPPPTLTDPAAITAPYELYVVTQGVHGLSYGHMAIDIAAGKGEPINSPISGVVTEQYIDAVGNTTLVIENDHYAVTLLHGLYTVDLGDSITIGAEIGVESNIGNTRDMQGNSCRNRDCGYHTHLNVFDKEAGTNINPLTLFNS
jgi:murein DD-endopeptidase MepM/ murein hydrolase activator NlpD